MDKENTPPPERRGPRAMTPPPDGERRLPMPSDVMSRTARAALFTLPSTQDEHGTRKPGYADDKANIESGHAKAVRER